LLHAANREAVKHKSGDGFLPLHLALMYAASETTVQMLCKANPAAAKQTDEKGYLPLHLSLKYVASDSGEVQGFKFRRCTRLQKLLLEANREAAKVEDRDGNLPLHLAVKCQAPEETVRLLLAANSAATKQTDQSGNMPLPLALMYAASKTTVQMLCKANPDALMEKNHSGHLPLHLAEKHEASGAIVPLLCAEAFTRLCYALKHRESEATVQRLCPAIRNAVQETDEDGNLPLHLALTNKYSEATVGLLLDTNLDAAKQTDATGCLPLHLALTNALTYEALTNAVNYEALTTALTYEASTDTVKTLRLLARAYGPPAIERKLWGDVVDPCAADIAMQKDEHGNSALHLALTREAPEKTVRLLHAANREVVKENSKECLKLALEHPAAAAVIEALADGMPSDRRIGKECLQLALEHPAAAAVIKALADGMPNDRRIEWLHLALNHWESSDTSPQQEDEKVIKALADGLLNRLQTECPSEVSEREIVAPPRTFLSRLFASKWATYRRLANIYGEQALAAKVRHNFIMSDLSQRHRYTDSRRMEPWQLQIRRLQRACHQKAPQRMTIWRLTLCPSPSPTSSRRPRQLDPPPRPRSRPAQRQRRQAPPPPPRSSQRRRAPPLLLIPLGTTARRW
jgi:ankyrin repeat protein